MWPETIDEARQLIADAIVVFGKFKPEAADWLAEPAFKSNGPRDWDLYLALMRDGERVAATETAAFGHEKWFNIARPAWDMLTDAGKVDPREALDELLSHLFWMTRLPYRRRQLRDLLTIDRQDGKPFYVSVEIDADELCCKTAQAAAGKRFPLTDYPDLPLPECDQVWCKCDWRANFK